MIVKSEMNLFSRRITTVLLCCTVGVGTTTLGGCVSMDNQATSSIEKAAKQFAKAARKNEVKSVVVPSFEVYLEEERRGKNPGIIGGAVVLLFGNWWWKKEDPTHGRRDIRDYSTRGQRFADAFVAKLIRHAADDMVVTAGSDADLERLIPELKKRHDSGAFDQEGLKEIGKVANSEAIVFGTVHFNNQFVSLKMLNAETAEVIAAYDDSL